MHRAQRLSASSCFGLVLAVVVAVGCSSPTVTTSPASGRPSDPSSSVPGPASTTSPADAQRQDAQVGDTLDLTGTGEGERMAVTVTRVVDPAAAGVFGPDAGKRFVAVQFRLRNTGTAVYADAPSNGAQVVDTLGQAFNATVLETAAGPSFPGSVRLTPGSTALGFITFEVPKGSAIAKVQFTLNSGLAANTGQWTVQRVEKGAPATGTAPAPQPTASTAPTSAAEGTSPRQVVENYYAAINAHDYATAWALGGKNLDSSLQSFTAGFAGTANDAVTVTGVEGDTVSVVLDATQQDGSHRVFSGTYTVRDGTIVSANIH
ncbi:DUF4352 domain-containing protein [Streptomyces sp. H39-S7]|uniref:DUF4352 domain-containing protein n=1 Tax=Streptomyces sp. H39-S7 TaxID=3004357 RepID=UPI0022AF9EEF|nr:DUF4352 domain-containing protein [Streptomyces sp. H39-S7]MCZ4119416.1 DUF4352 domain-containing protein [Streptomyces sp. H39-S7]